MPTLSLRDEKTGQSWQVWPDAVLIAPGAVHELGCYLFELSGCAEAEGAELRIDEKPLEALRSKEADFARWRWSPGFQAGTVLAELAIPGRSLRRVEIITDPDCKKLTRDHFDSMLREIIEDTYALFALSGFRKAVSHGTGGKPPAIARLEFLRSRIDELEKVVTAITRNPRRRLAAVHDSVPYYRASRATGPEILRSLRSGRVVHESAGVTRLPAVLRGCLPARIRISRKTDSLDTPEHRQIGACLRSWSAWLTSVSSQLESSGGDKDQERLKNKEVWAIRCRNLARRVRHLAEDPVFSASADTGTGLHLSSVFRNDPAYHAFYRLWQDMNRGIAAVFGAFLDMPLARTWELYELWCFLRLLRAAAEEFGGTTLNLNDLFVRDAAGGVTLTKGAVAVSIGSDWKLCFQKEYREFWHEEDGCGSYSRTMTPDIVAVRTGDANGLQAKVIILDAKYRIDGALNDAISSIHTYRDALVQESSGVISGIVSAAYLLTPHLALSPAAGYRNAPMPGRLFRPDYQAAFRFGAIQLSPGMSIADIATALRQITRDATAT